MMPTRPSQTMMLVQLDAVTSSRSRTALSYLKIDGLKVKYQGPGEDDAEAATVRTNHPVPSDCPLFYFEVHVLSKGQLGFIGVGYQTEEVFLSRLPGWDPHSYGYHGDDGHAFNGSGQGVAYGPTYTAGDVIGALLSRVDNTIRYYKNGTDLGIAFHNVMEERLFPCVGLRTRGEEVQVNLGRPGDAPFVSDLESVVSATRQEVLNSINITSVPLAASDGSPLLARLLHDHLLHNRCWKTAELLAKDLVQGKAHGVAPDGGANNQDVPMEGMVEGASSSQAGVSSSQSGAEGTGMVLSETQLTPHSAARQAAFELIVSGDIEGVRQLLEKQFGAELLTKHSSLDFRLKVARFCELLRPGGPEAVEAAVSYGRAALALHTPKTAADEELLCDALSLLAYENPATSPSGHLLSQPVRVSLAEDVDRVLLTSVGLPPTSPLERLVSQAWTTLECLKSTNHPQALLLDTRGICFGP